MNSAYLTHLISSGCRHYVEAEKHYLVVRQIQLRVAQGSSLACMDSGSTASSVLAVPAIDTSKSVA